jgi:hypothetical protein
VGTIVRLTVIIRLDCSGQPTDDFDVPLTGSHYVELLITVLAIQTVCASVYAFAHSYLMFIAEVKDGYFCIQIPA